DAPLVINSASLVGADSASFSMTSSFPITVAPGDSAAINVRFSPTARRSYTTTLRVSTDASTSTNDYIVSSRGIAPVISAPSFHDVGNARVGTTVTTLPVKINNNGELPLVINSLT